MFKRSSMQGKYIIPYQNSESKTLLTTIFYWILGKLTSKKPSILLKEVIDI